MKVYIIKDAAGKAYYPESYGDPIKAFKTIHERPALFTEVAADDYSASFRIRYKQQFQCEEWKLTFWEKLGIVFGFISVAKPDWYVEMLVKMHGLLSNINTGR